MDDNFLDSFDYHTPTSEQVEQMKLVRGVAKNLARAINSNVPDGADKSAAMRKLRECVMTCNAAIVLEKK
ncbi:MAG: hypothetical protein MSG64_07505 [Pyrinomonadaceae bacterium MAG19_C2-C3]|nr:hypothetical protein [Pyrinomonadaceae bacterium MAG19_C2-C3]